MTQGTPAHAVVWYSPGWRRRVGGMTLLERAVLSARRVGIEALTVIASPEEVEQLQAGIAGGRLAQTPPELEIVGSAAERWDASRQLIGAGTRGVICARPAALDPGFLSGVLEALSDGAHPEGIRFGDDHLLCLTADAAPASAAQLPPGDAAAYGGAFAPVNDGSSGRRARRALLAQSAKPLHIDGLVCYYFLRYVSPPVSTVLLGTPITPNMITGLSLVLGVAAGVAAAMGGYMWPAIGGGLLMLSLLFDLCDGEVARTKFKFSDWGAWFDIYADFVVNTAFVIGMAIGGYRTLGHPIYLYAGAFAIFSYSLYNGLVFRYIHKLGIPDEFLFKWWFDQQADHARATAGDDEALAEPTAETEGPSGLGRFLSGLKYLGRRDFFIFAYLVSGLLGVLHWVFWATVAGALMNFGMTVYHTLVWKGLPPPRGDEVEPSV